MTFRTRLLIGFTIAAVVPLGLIAVGVRREVTDRLTVQFHERRRAQVSVAEQDLRRESARIAERLRALATSLAEDDRFRQAAVRGDPGARPYLLDYGTRAMAVTGLSMFQLQDSAGRILSSGHFRQEFDRLEPELAILLSASGGGLTLVPARSPSGAFVALARIDSTTIGGRRFVLVGGTTVDSASLAAITRGQVVQARLVIGDSVIAATEAPYAEAAEDTVALTYVVVHPSGNRLAPAHLVLSHSRAELNAVTRDVNRWFAVAIALVALASLGIAWWLSSAFSRPLAELAQATSHIQLSGGDVALPTDRSDEIGTLARRLKALTARLRGSAAKLRDAERRATVGELARQVNHDIKNGLIPIRNVLRHLSGVAEQEPAALPTAFGERRATLESSVEYLDTLARNYAKLMPRADRARVDVNAVVAEAVRSASATEKVEVRAELAPSLPPVAGDAVALRRIVDNLVTNAIESVDGAGGTVRIRTEVAGDAIAIVVADTGRGMSAEELSRAFEDFYTTKADGTGLGLSVVRRLTSDMGGEVRAESEPGRGTTVTVTLPTSA